MKYKLMLGNEVIAECEDVSIPFNTNKTFVSGEIISINPHAIYEGILCIKMDTTFGYIWFDYPVNSEHQFKIGEVYTSTFTTHED